MWMDKAKGICLENEVRVVTVISCCRSHLVDRLMREVGERLRDGGGRGEAMRRESGGF